jgi:F-type H+-transporting ATPase subunit gamma
MRQRIKAIQTIKKITHAMRLISMSTHSRMKNQEAPLDLYKKTINRLFLEARNICPIYKNPILEPGLPLNEHALIILIGSQKGLCGSFNSTLFQLFNTKVPDKTNYTFITIGKRATNYIQKNSFGRLTAFYNTFSLHNALTIADSLLQEITQSKHPYSSVTIYSNSAPSFFLQKPLIHQIIPTHHKSEKKLPLDVPEWEQPSQDILAFLANQYILSQIQYHLFQSLLAEHSARFISMDSSTRNAENLLEQMQRDYNKLRQTKITRELTELSSFFLS